MSLCYLTSAPYEILTNIGVELSALSPIGSPSHLLPLMQTCSTLNRIFSPKHNPSFYAAVFDDRLDYSAPVRRFGRLTTSQRAEWGWRAFKAMKVFRRGDLRCDEEILEAFRMGTMLMLDDDGKNFRQMLFYGRADVFVRRFVMQRVYERAMENNGWPLETPLISYALYLMWLLTSEESLRSEPKSLREHIQKLLLAFVYAPFRYPITPFPPNHYIIPPLLPSSREDPTTIETAHGPYPLYPESLAADFALHNGDQVEITPPPPALSAKLLYLSRAEIPTLTIPPHLDRTRADRLAKGLTDISPVRENLEELDWGFIAYPPLGTGYRTREGVRKLHPEWNGREYQMFLRDDPEGYPQRPPAMSFPGFDIPPPLPRWVGKAPLYDELEKSRKWDMDVKRMLAWPELQSGKARKPFEDGVYELGTADGMWTGRMIMPDVDESQNLVMNPLHPPYDEFTAESLGGFPMFCHMRLRELHGVYGEVTPPPLPASPSTSGPETPSASTSDSEDDKDEEEEREPFALGPLSEHDGMNNAWFSGRPRVIQSSYRDTPGTVRLAVQGHPGIGLYRQNTRYGGRWKDCKRLGNDATPSPPPTTATPQMEEEPEGYSHDSTCLRCKDDDAFESMIKNAMGRGSDDAFKLWEQGRVRDKCKGVSEIVILGETEEEHGQAFHHYVLEGRVRPSDGMVLLYRRPRDPDGRVGSILYWGYFVGKDTLVGNWRAGMTDVSIPGWEGSFAWTRRHD